MNDGKAEYVIDLYGDELQRDAAKAQLIKLGYRQNQGGLPEGALSVVITKGILDNGEPANSFWITITVLGKGTPLPIEALYNGTLAITKPIKKENKMKQGFKIRLFESKARYDLIVSMAVELGWKISSVHKGFRLGQSDYIVLGADGEYLHSYEGVVVNIDDLFNGEIKPFERKPKFGNTIDKLSPHHLTDEGLTKVNAFFDSLVADGEAKATDCS